jgi:hypothetical protein
MKMRSIAQHCAALLEAGQPNTTKKRDTQNEATIYATQNLDSPFIAIITDGDLKTKPKDCLWILIQHR